MEKETHQSSSAVQKDMEENIITALTKSLSHVEKLHSAAVNSEKGNYSFHFDFHELNKNIIGEIYSCAFPLKAGHVRKIKSDILKMITYEKLAKKKMEKYMVLTVSPDYLREKCKIEVSDKMEGTILENAEVSVLGNASWLIGSIESFNINILYYVLDKDQESKLTITRANQSKGMRL
jgi:translation initiation factor IF-2